MFCGTLPLSQLTFCVSLCFLFYLYHHISTFTRVEVQEHVIKWISSIWYESFQIYLTIFQQPQPDWPRQQRKISRWLWIQGGGQWGQVNVTWTRRLDEVVWCSKTSNPQWPQVTSVRMCLGAGEDVFQEAISESHTTWSFRLYRSRRFTTLFLLFNCKNSPLVIIQWVYRLKSEVRVFYQPKTWSKTEKPIVNLACTFENVCPSLQLKQASFAQ